MVSIDVLSKCSVLHISPAQMILTGVSKHLESGPFTTQDSGRNGTTVQPDTQSQIAGVLSQGIHKFAHGFIHFEEAFVSKLGHDKRVLLIGFRKPRDGHC